MNFRVLLCILIFQLPLIFLKTKKGVELYYYYLMLQKCCVAMFLNLLFSFVVLEHQPNCG